MFRMFSGKRKAIVAGAAFVALTAAAFNVPVSKRPASGSAPSFIAQGPVRATQLGETCTTGTAPPFYCLGGANLSAVNGFTYGVYGVEGYAPNATGGIGLLGYSGSSSVRNAYGMYGVTFSPQGIGVYGAGDGPTPAPGATPSSTQQSTGVVGNSSSGAGVYGSTRFPNSSDDEEDAIAGVEGVDGDGTEFNDGVLGITTGGGYGVQGSSGSDAEGGVFGFATSGDGVDAVTSSGTGVFAESTSGYGVHGVSNTGSALVASSTSGDAIFARTGGGTGADIANSNGNGLVSAGTYIGIISRAPAGASTYPIVLTDAVGNNLFYVDGDGDVFYHGSLNTFARTRHGFVSNTFTPRASAPTIEDVGTAQLVNGQAQVRIDPAMAESMDQSTAYHVFLTPDGDTKGLFVAQKTPQGFVVRETQGGRGTFAFDYRIVGSVDGQATRRIALSTNTEMGPRAQRSVSETRPVERDVFPMNFEKRAAIRRSHKLARHAGFAPPHIYMPQPNLAVENRLH